MTKRVTIESSNLGWRCQIQLNLVEAHSAKERILRGILRFLIILAASGFSYGRLLRSATLRSINSTC